MQHKNNSRGKEWWLWQRKWWCHWQALKYLYHNGFCGRTHEDCVWEERRSFSSTEQSLQAVSTETSVKAPLTSCLDVSVAGIWSSSTLCVFIHRCPSPTALRPPSVCLLSIISPPALRPAPWTPTPATWALRCLRWTRVCTASPWPIPRRQTAGAWSRWWASCRTPPALNEQRSRISR